MEGTAGEVFVNRGFAPSQGLPSMAAAITTNPGKQISVAKVLCLEFS
jgi:hypothetical protein